MAVLVLVVVLFSVVVHFFVEIVFVSIAHGRSCYDVFAGYERLMEKYSYEHFRQSVQPDEFYSISASANDADVFRTLHDVLIPLQPTASAELIAQLTIGDDATSAFGSHIAALLPGQRMNRREMRQTR